MYLAKKARVKMMKIAESRSSHTKENHLRTGWSESNGMRWIKVEITPVPGRERDGVECEFGICHGLL